MKTSIAVCALVLVAGAASAQVNITTGTSPTIPSNGLLNSAANGVVPFTYAGPSFPIGSYTINGRLTRQSGSPTLPEQSRMAVDLPGGGQTQVSSAIFTAAGWPASNILQASNINRRSVGNTSSQTGGSNTMQIMRAPAMMNAGSGALRFFETVDDNTEAQIDARWSSLNITINPVVAPTTAIDLGVINAPGVQINGTTTSASPVAWFKFTIDAKTDSSNRYLDIFTRQSGAAFDTAMALFRGSDGALLSVDDEDGTGSFSQLSFGEASSTDGPRVDFASLYTGSTGGNGRDAALDAGTYYLAVAHYDAIFNAAGTAVTADAGFFTTGTGTFGSFQLNVLSNVPAPGALAMLGLGGLVATRRRRA